MADLGEYFSAKKSIAHRHFFAKSVYFFFGLCYNNEEYSHFQEKRPALPNDEKRFVL